MGYKAENLLILKGLESIRKHPGMYIGDTNAKGVLNCLIEVLDNSVDEHLAMRCSSIIINIGNSITVVDDGNGIPAKKIKGQDTLISVTSKIHSSWKYNQNTYAASGGKHGVGIKATNALSSSFWLATKTASSNWEHVFYEKGNLQKRFSDPACHLVPKKALPKTGTVVSFVPDPSIFSESINIDDVVAWCKIKSYLTKLKITLIHANNSTVFCNSEGLPSYIQSLGAKVVASHATKEFAYSLGVTDSTDPFYVEGFCNSLHNKQGGTHVSTFVSQIESAIKKHYKKGGGNLLSGMVAILNVVLPQPEFGGGQTKERLIDKRALSLEFKIKIPKDVAKAQVEKAAILLENISAKKQQLDLKRAVNDKALPSKLTIAKCKPYQRELYLVEGDSAAGTAKIARDSKTQEVLPIGGKILNVYKDKKPSQDVIDILNAVGIKPHLSDPYKNIRINKIFVLSDPDVDGYHISTLILAVLNRFAKKLIEERRVFVVDSPEYFAVDPKKGPVYGATVQEVAKQTKQPVKHIKGWAEIPPKIMRAIAFAKDRKLIQIEPASEKAVSVLMSDDTAVRKQILGL
jgi:DNA gyrase subunit B